MKSKISGNKKMLEFRTTVYGGDGHCLTQFFINWKFLSHNY